MRRFDVPEVLGVQVVPLSDEVRIVPVVPTATNNPIDVVVLSVEVVEVVGS